MAKAMVIDDSRAIRHILTRTLSELGYEVSEANDGKQGFEKLEGAPPGIGLILVDWNMPEMNGLEFVKKVRSHSKYNTIKLMMVTTETQMDQMMAALEAGANEYVMKPFTREIIEDKLRLLGELQ